MNNKNKVGRPKLADKNLKIESIIISFVAIIFSVFLLVVGCYELVTPQINNTDVKKLKGLSQKDYISNVFLKKNNNKTDCNIILNIIGSGKYKIVATDTLGEKIATIDTDGVTNYVIISVPTKASYYLTLSIDGPLGSKKYRIHYSWFTRSYTS